MNFFHHAQSKALIEQPIKMSTNDTTLARSEMTTITSMLIIMLICSPVLFLVAKSGVAAHKKRRAVRLKEQIQKLEKCWRIACDRNS
jgi:hypothetical protein